MDMDKGEMRLLIDSLRADIKSLKADNEDLKVQLDVANARNKKLLVTACEKMGESKRVSRMLTDMDAELSETKRKLAFAERENRNLVLWLKIKGEEK